MDKVNAFLQARWSLRKMMDDVLGFDADRDWMTAAVRDDDTAAVVAAGRFAAGAAG